MKEKMILGIDTATRWAGLALHNGSAVLAEQGWRCVNTHTIELAPAVDRMLRRVGVSAPELEGIAVAIGPGSYTGLRVGLALAKGLALANQTPLVGVSTLDIVAASFGPMVGQLLVVAEAGRRRVCAAVYRWQHDLGWQASQKPVIETWEALLDGLQGTTTFAGEIDRSAAELIRAADDEFHLASPAARVRRSGYLAELGWQRLRRGDVDDASSLAPVYLRDPTGH